MSYFFPKDRLHHIKIRNLVKCLVHFLLNYCTLIMYNHAKTCEIGWQKIASTLLIALIYFTDFLKTEKNGTKLD